MSVVLLNFSGTGNTAWISKKLAEQFRQKGIVCDIQPWEELAETSLQLQWDFYDLVGLGFPVHAFDAPAIIYELLDRLPRKRQRYFLYKTAGSLFALGGSTRRLRLKLADRGWQLQHEAVYLMPPNMGGTASQEKVTKRCSIAQNEVEIAVSQILNNDRIVLPDTPLMHFCSLLNRLETRGLPRLSGKWKANARCFSCGKCVNLCPRKNISLDKEGLHFADKCVFCLRCWWICPVHALSNSMIQPALLKAPYKLPD